MRLLRLISTLFILLYSIILVAKTEATAKSYRKSVLVTLDKKMAIDIIANFDFSRFETNPNLKLFEIQYSNDLSSNMFGKSATIYLGEKRKSASIDSVLIPRLMHINQQKVDVTEEAEAKKVLSKKPGFNGQNIDFKTNKNGLKMALANFSKDGGDSYFYLMVLGRPTVIFTEANMIDPESIRFE